MKAAATSGLSSVTAVSSWKWRGDLVGFRLKSSRISRRRPARSMLSLHTFITKYYLIVLFYFYLDTCRTKSMGKLDLIYLFV